MMNFLKRLFKGKGRKQGEEDEREYEAMMEKVIDKHYPKYNVPIKEGDPPFLNQFRDFHRGKKVNELEGNYFQFRDDFLEARKSGNLSKAIGYSNGAIGFIEPLVLSFTLNGDSFRIEDIFCLDEGIYLSTLAGVDSQVENYGNLINAIKELKKFQGSFKEAREKGLIARRVLKLVKENEGILQSNLRKKFNEEERQIVSRVSYDLERFGLLRREKESTRKIFLFSTSSL